MCTACMKPVEYGDLSDIDEERDSSRYEMRELSSLFPGSCALYHRVNGNLRVFECYITS